MNSTNMTKPKLMLSKDNAAEFLRDIKPYAIANERAYGLAFATALESGIAHATAPVLRPDMTNLLEVNRYNECKTQFMADLSTRIPEAVRFKILRRPDHAPDEDLMGLEPHTLGLLIRKYLMDTSAPEARAKRATLLKEYNELQCGNDFSEFHTGLMSRLFKYNKACDKAEDFITESSAVAHFIEVLRNSRFLPLLEAVMVHDPYPETLLEAGEIVEKAMLTKSHTLAMNTQLAALVEHASASTTNNM